MAEPGSLQPSSSGIALVMVLGILSVMVIMAVAFAISMRTERVAAGNYADSVRARQLVHVGLARALDDLAGKLGSNGLMSAGGGANYPPWDVTNSYTLNYTNTSTNVNALQLLALNRENEATNFVPRALWTAATNADYTKASNHWVLVDSIITNSSGTESNRMGRVKYLILNCSGLLDANFAGGAVRGLGTNPMEIAINTMPEFKPTPDGAAAFLTRRDVDPNRDYRYETLDEFAVLNSNSFNVFPSNFTVYSYAPAGYWNTNLLVGVGTQVNLSGSVSDLTNRMSEITNAFAHAGFSQFESGVLYSNLIDYVDTDLVPSNFEYCVENVPMINEIAASCSLVADTVIVSPNIQYTVDYFLTNECWHPFSVNAAASFSNVCSVTFSGTHPPGNIIGSVSNIGAPLKESFVLITYTARVVFTESSPLPSYTLNSIIELSNTVNNTFVVDKLMSPITLSFSVNPAGGASFAGVECLDPRFNSNPLDPNQWRSESTFTLGRTNTWTESFLPSSIDGDAGMFVANRPLLSVAELGYLVYTNAPWRTVKLYGPTLHRVLDVFGLSTNTSDILMTNTVYHGRVNCNSNSALDATAVVFAGMPVDQYPGGLSTPVSMPNAQIFASEIFAGGICTNLSDVGRSLIQSSFPLATTELERESYFRNSMNLLNVRQNLFAIIIEAHVASGGNIPRNPVKQRAVALVWRDPYTGEMFVRSIKWLKD